MDGMGYKSCLQGEDLMSTLGEVTSSAVPDPWPYSFGV